MYYLNTSQSNTSITASVHLKLLLNGYINDSGLRFYLINMNVLRNFVGHEVKVLRKLNRPSVMSFTYLTCLVVHKGSKYECNQETGSRILDSSLFSIIQATCICFYGNYTRVTRGYLCLLYMM